MKADQLGSSTETRRTRIDKARVLAISRQFLFREGIEHSLSGLEDIEISAVAEANDEGLSVIDSWSPDVVLLDIDALSDNGLTLAHEIRRHARNIGLIVITSNPSDAQLFDALKAHATAYLNKEITGDQLADIVRRVAHGERPIEEGFIGRPAVARQVLGYFQQLLEQSDSERVVSPLTQRGTDVLDCMAKGYRNRQIASQLGISEQTVKNHVTQVLHRLHASARTEAVLIAIKRGLVSVS